MDKKQKGHEKKGVTWLKWRSGRHACCRNLGMRASTTVVIKRDIWQHRISVNWCGRSWRVLLFLKGSLRRNGGICATGACLRLYQWVKTCHSKTPVGKVVSNAGPPEPEKFGKIAKFLSQHRRTPASKRQLWPGAHFILQHSRRLSTTAAFADGTAFLPWDVDMFSS